MRLFKYFLSYSGVPLSDSFNLKEQLESIAKSASESGDEVLFELNCTTSSEPLALCHDAEYRGHCRAFVLRFFFV